MPKNDEEEQEVPLSPVPSPQQQQQTASFVDRNDNVPSTATSSELAAANVIFNLMTQNLLATTMANNMGLSPTVTAEAAVASAFGLPNAAIMYGLNGNLINLNWLTQTQSQQSQQQQQSPSVLQEYMRQSMMQQQQQQQQQHQDQQQEQGQKLQQGQQFDLKLKKRSYPCSFQWCVLCKKEVHSSKLPCHIRQIHVAKPMFMCPQCKFNSTYSKNNVKSHMSTVHGLTAEPNSLMENYAAEVEEFMKICFPTVRGRGRPVHNNTRPSTASTASSSSPQDVEPSNTSRRNSGSSVVSTNGISARYTHSHRRRGIRRPVQEVIHQAGAKRVKYEKSHRNNSEQTSSHISSGALDQCYGLDEGNCSGGGNILQSGINGTTTYRNGIDGYCNGNGTSSYHDGTNRSGTMDNGSSSNSSEHANRDGDSRESVDRSNSRGTESNGSSAHDFDEAEQQLRHSEYIRPRYFPQHINWYMLANDQLRGTIFESLQLNDVLRKFGQQRYGIGNSAFLTEEQLKQVQEVRRQISLDVTKLRDALCSLDLNILPIEQVDLIRDIAPSSIDVNYLLNCESADPRTVAGENEQFLLKLAKIDRVAEKLHAMSFMGHVNSRVTEILKSFEELNDAAKALKENRGFHVLLRVVLVLMNFIIGDFTARTNQGFRVSELAEICSTEVCTSPKTTLLDVVASTTVREFTEVRTVRDTLPALERAARVNFHELSAAVHRFERDYSRFDREASRMDHEGYIAGYREAMKNKMTELRDGYRECKTALSRTMRFFGELVDEDRGPEIPETFFASIAAFYRQLQRAWLDVHLHGGSPLSKTAE